MAQRDKVKELVGRGLNSYHTKSLQQMNRIEKKNKEQNHKISILSNELDNDYLTKTEEGSVISLEHSKEGMVYLDELQGNTLVNYCVDGAKEFTLNDDINEFGTAVKLTETVDDGQVDVLAEGNTMVNVCDQQEAVAITKSYTVESGNHIALQGEYDGKARPVVTGNTLVNLAPTINYTYDYSKGNHWEIFGKTIYPLQAKDYTIILNIKENTLDVDWNIWLGSSSTSDTLYGVVMVPAGYTGIYSNKFTPPVNTLDVIREEVVNATSGSITISDVILLEGDYTNKPIPDYFTGMQSSFEDKVVPENLSDIPNVETATTVGGRAWTTTNLMPAGEYTFIFTAKTSNSLDKRIQIGVTDTPYIGNQSEFGSYLYTHTNISSEYFTYATKITLSESKYVGIRVVGSGGCFKDVYLLEGDYTNYDFSDYDPTKAGKYRVDYKVTGKNKFDTAKYFDCAFGSKAICVKAKANTTYTYSSTYKGVVCFALYKQFSTLVPNDDKNKSNVIFSKADATPGFSYTTPNYDCYIWMNLSGSNSNQLEEGSTATTYEPYKESIKTYYLNSPLLEGDTIEESNGNVYHVHRYKELFNKDIIAQAVFNEVERVNGIAYKIAENLYSGTCLSDKLQYVGSAGNMVTGINQFYLTNDGNIWVCLSNTLTLEQSQEFINNCRIIIPIASPQYELISQNDTILTDSYVAGHLDFDTAVPVERVKFNGFGSWVNYLYPSTEYIVQFESDNVGKISYIGLNWKAYCSDENVVKGINKFRVLIDSTINSGFFEFSGIGFSASNIVVTEATDKDFGYFKGMKSVGEQEGNKIEILSQNKNLLPLSHIPTDSEGYANRQRSNWDNVKLKPNTKYTLSYTGKATNYTNDYMWGIWIREQKTGKAITDNHIIKSEVTDISLSFTTTNEEYYKIQLVPNNGDATGSYLFKPNTVILEEGEKTSYIPYALNKKEILLNEPLRSLPVGDKDRFVKIGGKWFIERNIRQKLLTGADSENWLIHSDSDENVIEFRCNTGSPFITNNSGSTISDKFIGKSGGNVDRIAWAGDTVYITISRNKLATVDVAGFRQWLSNNNVLVQNQLATPIYEPLEVEPTLLTYNDVTHISNNSIIPCTMKIKNTGYNAIIKPSTLYTVALDTNKSGTVGINLGGAKVTTTSNVLTLTTPATLTDDSLRIYGKGIKGSKVRLLEGDKTNWIPSHFEGMKSSFEDKFDVTDNTYKMEILSNNKNLWVVNNKTAQKDNLTVEFDHDTQIITVNGVCNIDDLYIYQGREYIIKDIPKNELNYTLSYEIVSGSYDITNSVRNSFGYIGISSREFGTPINIGGLNMISGNSVSFKMKNQPNETWFRLDKGTVFNNLKLKISLEPYIRKTDYVKPSFNKIQFSSIEPLRKWDRFVFKDGRLMIERGSGVRVFDGNDSDLMFSYEFPSSIRFRTNTNIYLPYGLTVSNKFFNGATGNGVSFNMMIGGSGNIEFIIPKNQLASFNLDGGKQWLQQNPTTVIYQLAEPTYEEVPHELSKIILEGYENGTLFIDTNIPPTSTITYAGETPIVKSVKLNKTEVLSNTEDINDNIIPYLMDMDYRVVMLQLATEELEGGVSMARLFGGTYEMIKRDILSKRLTREEYGHRLADYFNAGKLTEEQVRELEDLR